VIDETMTRQGLELLRMTTADAGEVLTVQRAAYVSEAQLYKDAFLPALTQTLDQLVDEIETGGGFVLRVHGRLVGAVRTRIVGGLLHIGRLTEKAANTVLNKVEEASPIQDRLVTAAGQLRAEWTFLFPTH